MNDRGPKQSFFGDTVSSGLGTNDEHASMREIYEMMYLLRGQIQQVYAVDDPDNDPTGNAPVDTRYDVIVFRRDGSSELLQGLTMMQPCEGGGINNFLEVLGVNPGPDATDPSVNPGDKPGQFVLVGFMEGSKAGGVILGTLPHTSPVAVANRPLKAAGTVKVGEFQGLRQEIDNDGAYTITFNGPRDDEGNPVNENGPTVIGIDKDGNVTVSTNNEQSVVVDRVNQTITATNGPTSVVMDGPNNTITQKAATVNTLGATLNRVQGDLVKISKTPDSEPTEPFVLGNVFTAMMDKFLTAVANHTHIGNLGVPTPPPINQADFVNIQASPIDDKKILSDFITGEKGS